MNKIQIGEIEYPVYATVEDADQYFYTTYGQKWCSLNISVKERLLISATRSIDCGDWIGVKVDKDQPLEFPRIYDKNEMTDDNLLMMACCEEAMAIYEDGSSDASSMAGVSSLRVQDTEIRFASNVKEGGLNSEMARKLLDKYAVQGVRILY